MMQKSLILGVVTAVLVAGSVDTAMAATDLAADNVTFAVVNGTAYATGHFSMAVSPDQDTYLFDYKLEQWRSGSLIATIGLTTYEIGPGVGANVNCPDTCQTSCTAITCKFNFNGTDYSGNCAILDTICPPTFDKAHCYCKAGSAKTSAINPMSGDVFKLVLVPEAGISEISTANNTISVTY